MKEVKTQIGISHSADFEENTWTFQMPDGYEVWAGEFAIVDKQVYEKLIASTTPHTESKGVEQEDFARFVDVQSKKYVYRI